VSDNLNALRVRPITGSSQRCDDFQVRVDPEARLHRHVDYFGTEVIEFGVAAPHDHLTIDVRARVVTGEALEPLDAPWELLRAGAYQDAAGEFVLDAPDQPEHPLLDDLQLALAAARTPLAALRLLCELVPDRFEYRQGATYVGSTVDDLLEAGAGVCQDFAHLGLLLLRRQGIASRYVSGYLWAAPEDEGDDSLEVQTDAWIEALLPGSGGRGEPVWVAADPTNRRLASETHVKIGHGRTYADVPPVRGVYRGDAAAALDASVTMTRLDPQASARA
jgi:transglutaminase-like putative cysteine protease